MTPASSSPLAATAAARSKPFSRIYPRRLTRVSCQATPDLPALSDNASSALPAPQPKWRLAVSAALAAAVLTAMPAYADLNKFEAEQRGEFGIGSADLIKAVHVNENFRRANFTAADMKEADFSGSTFNGAYLEKAVAYKANFTGADLSDTLMDRMVLNEANLTDAILVRSVLTRSDLAGVMLSTYHRSRPYASMQVGQTP